MIDFDFFLFIAFRVITFLSCMWTSANHLNIFYLANKSTLWRHQPQLCEFFFALAINLSPSLLSFYSAARRQLPEFIHLNWKWKRVSEWDREGKVINLHQCQRTIFNFDKLCNHCPPALVKNARNLSSHLIFAQSHVCLHTFRAFANSPQLVLDLKRHLMQIYSIKLENLSSHKPSYLVRCQKIYKTRQKGVMFDNFPIHVEFISIIFHFSCNMTMIILNVTLDALWKFFNPLASFFRSLFLLFSITTYALECDYSG